MAKKEVGSRYRESIMGWTWALLTPLILLAMYSVVFGSIFQSRWPGYSLEKPGSFAIALFIGMIIHGLVAECLNKAPQLITLNVNYVKNVVFPLEIFAYISTASALTHTAANAAILCLAIVFFEHRAPLAVLWLPVLLLPLAIFTVALGWLLSALGVFFRDLAQLTQLMSTALLFFSPVFYPISSVPESWRGLFMLNPLTYIIEESRNVILHDHYPDALNWLMYLALSLAFACISFALFQKSRKGFPDVL